MAGNPSSTPNPEFEKAIAGRALTHPESISRAPARYNHSSHPAGDSPRPARNPSVLRHSTDAGSTTKVKYSTQGVWVVRRRISP